MIQHIAKSIRPFIGAKNFEQSRSFYRDLGFEEVLLSPGFSVFKSGANAFYLQDYYNEDWINNTMVFMEIGDVQSFYDALIDLNLPEKYEGVRVKPIKNESWGRECFVHDPSGVLWHFGQFF
jgi:catechol 2,3-dioxygenase-like lactoylglutathione lyase family enzyme